ncbi:MAG TPA: ATP-binding protein [Rhizomicrobium sp.]|jgi:signal transduction histidine kinase/HPt (histidine-containing phosphotransfer) domain-containing protein|nr:ATP-binding protein [Rhizomicrobium sp.]
MTGKAVAQNDDARQIFAGRIDVLYSLGRHYLSLPFAVLCVPATVLAGHGLGFLPVTPLLLQIAVVIAAEQLTTAYRKRPVDSDPHFWARRYTWVSAIAGAVWGMGAVFWFAWGSFPAQAYLALAFLGMTATEFIARSVHRPAYAVHTLFALGPLVALLLLQGGLFPVMTAVLVAFFGAVLISYAPGMGKLIDEGLILRNENAELVQRLQSEKNEAILARDSAQASALAKSAFVANISHELRTPMNALLGMAQMLERADLPKQQADHVKVMLEAGRGLQTLLDDVIALTRDDEDALEDEDCDPVQTARAVTRLLQPRAWEKRLRLALTAQPELPRVAADPRRVRQALLKMADNALKFTEHGLVDIRLDLEHDKRGHAMVRFAVSDTGTGVAPDVAHLLFKPFSPGDSSYARKEQGAGLGLAVAKRIVEQAGGEVGFESTRGDGALFWFTLPVSGQAGVAAKGPAADIPAVPPHGLSLLICVPSCDVAASLADFLEPFGNRVTVAANAADAAARASRDNFDVLIAGSDESDLLAASPGVKAPILAVLLRGDRVPSATDCVLRWPVAGDDLFRALDSISTSATPLETEAAAPAAIDAVAFSTLEKSLGLKTLIEILQCYVVNAEQLTKALSDACVEERWDDAARLAHDIVGAAGGLGLAAMSQAARHFAQATRDGENPNTLRSAAQQVMGEHVRSRKALINLYPELA